MKDILGIIIVGFLLTYFLLPSEKDIPNESLTSKVIQQKDSIN